MPAPYFFFRPLLGASRSWVGIDWQVVDTTQVKAGDYARCFSENSTMQLADKLPLVLSIDSSYLGQQEFFQKFKAAQAIFVLPPDTIDDPASLDLCKNLRKSGHRLALRVEEAGSIKRIPVAAFDHLKFDAHFVRHELPAADLLYTRDAGFQRIAAQVATHELFNWLTDKKFEFCDGSFVTVVDPVALKETDLSHLKVLKLISLIVQDADSREIESVFREEPKLSYNLLRLVNSVAIGAGAKISSFHQAIAILGRRQLQRWLQLLIYANQVAHSNEPNPLMQLAAARGRQMELLCESLESPPDVPELADAAFMTGIFSLLDVLLKLPMSEILEALPLQDHIHEALGARGGVLGDLLKAVIAAESCASGDSSELACAEEILARYNIDPTRHAMAQTIAYYWASRINLA